MEFIFEQRGGGGVVVGWLVYMVTLALRPRAFQLGFI